jgi:hypothetical protein
MNHIDIPFVDALEFHALTFIRISKKQNGTIEMIDKACLYTDREPPSMFKLDGMHPFCQGYCIFVYFFIIDNEDLAIKLNEWKNDIVVVCHDELVVMPDLNNIMDPFSHPDDIEKKLIEIGAALGLALPEQRKGWYENQLRDMACYWPQVP